MFDNKKLQDEFDCETCLLKEYKKDRHCFLFDEVNDVDVPLFEVQEDGSIWQSSRDGFPLHKNQSYERDEFLNELSWIQKEYFPDHHVFEVLKAHFFGGPAINDSTGNRNQKKMLCPQGLIGDEEELSLLHTLESWAQTYRILPFPGGILDQPNIVFEAFNMIRYTNNYYDNEKIRKMEDQSKQNQKRVKK